jgi:hypothetical protein
VLRENPTKLIDPLGTESKEERDKQVKAWANKLAKKWGLEDVHVQAEYDEDLETDGFTQSMVERRS